MNIGNADFFLFGTIEAYAINICTLVYFEQFLSY